MKLLCILLIFVVSSSCFAQSNPFLAKIDNQTVFFIDSQRVQQKEINKYRPTDIASVSVIKDKAAIDLIGPDGKNGVVFIETKEFAKTKYLRYLKSKSQEYAAIINSLKSDSSIQYILNGRILKNNFAGDLSLIDDKNFKSIHVIDKITLQNQYKIVDREYGVIIEADMPKYWYHDQ